MESSQTFGRSPHSPLPGGVQEEKRRHPFRWQNIVSVLVLGLSFWLLLRVLLVPDPGGDLLFRRALRLERQNLIEPAIRQYRLLSDSRPDSPHAPDALWHQAELLLELARAGDLPRLGEALAAYKRLAGDYRQSELAGRSLLRIGALSTSDLRDYKAARQVYERVLREYPNNREFASQAALQLGRVAIAVKDARGAQRWLQLVSRAYPSLIETAAQAQYLLGETYETLWRNPQHMMWARNAYELTISKYPQSVWAAKAKERRASLIYGEVAPLARRVLIAVASMPDEGSSNGSLFSALHRVLSARGIEADDITLAGLGLEPFYAAFSPDDPARVVAPPFDAFENAVAATGLIYDELDTGSDPRLALKMLQDEIDDARVVLVYTGRWNLVTGYDSGRNRIFLQDRGARRVAVASADFVKAWKTKSSRGTPWTLLSFHLPGEIVKLQPSVGIPSGDIATGETAPGQSLIGAPAKNGLANKPLDFDLLTGSPKKTGANVESGLPAVLHNSAQTRARVSPQISPLQPPTLLYTLNPLSERATYRRSLARAAAKMQKPSEGRALLNLSALRAIAAQMKRLSLAPSKIAPPVEEPVQEDSPPSQPSDSELPVRSESGLAREQASDEPDSQVPVGDPNSDQSAPDGANGTATTPAPDSNRGATAGATNRDAPASGGVVAKVKKGVLRVPRFKPGDALNQARAILGWRDAPLARWIAARRQAAGFLDRAATRMKEPALRQAADNFRQSIAALEQARTVLPASNALSSGGTTLSLAARRDFALAARLIERAAQAEAQATDIMRLVGA